MELKANFKIIYSEEAINFINAQDEKVRAKIYYNINRSKYVIDKDLFKKLGDSEIWEFRTKYNGMEYRLLAFWDNEENRLVVATHGFIKKKQKTPQKEISRAEQIR